MSDEDGFTFEWPLWGASLVDRATGLEGALQIHDTFLYQPTWEQWGAMESRAVADDYFALEVARERIGKPVTRLPPPCLLRFSAPGRDGQPDSSLTDQDTAAGLVVAAMRLYDGGEFINPTETGTYIAHPEGIMSRLVSVFRCAPYGWVPEKPYRVGAPEAEDIAHMMVGVDDVAQDPRHANAALAIENFVLSFALAISPAERALHRCIALEALFGGMRREVDGASVGTRLSHAVQSVTGEPGPDVQGLLEWVIELRNAVAHRLDEARIDRDDETALEEVTRAGLVAYLNHLHTDGDDTLRSFNRALAAGPIPMG